MKPIDILLVVLLGAGPFALGGPLPAEAYPGLRDPQGSLIPGVTGHLGGQVVQRESALDPELLKRRNNFGYSEEEIENYFSKPVPMILDETGLDRSLIKPVPPPGVHPRVLFNPEDVPLIRERLISTEAGRSAMDAIRENNLRFITGPDAKFGAQYASLINGEPVEGLDSNVAYCLMYEAFRCLMDNDEKGGKRVAAAITTLAQMAEKEMAANLADPRNAGSLNDARIISQGPTREFTLGLDYDFAYNFMTPEQRNIVRGVLAKATAGMTGIGCETLQALHSVASNWISWGARALFAICAIEGEPGYDPAAFRRFADAQIHFINAMYPSGEAFEGWGKNFMFFEHMILLAKRGEPFNVIGHTDVRAAYNDYFIASMSPWGNSFTFCDSMAKSGGSIARNADVLMYRRLFPDDPAGQFVYRNQIRGDYANVGRNTINTRHPFSTMDALCCAIFAADIASRSAEEEFRALTKGRPLTYFSHDTCNLITRSEWSKDALYLNYLNRALPGGHQYCDRSHFNLYADGRFWSIYQSSRQIKDQYGPTMRSVVMADGMGPSTAEAECIEFRDGPLATSITTDLSNPWAFQTAGLVRPPGGAELVKKTRTYNSFRLTPSPVPWMDLPIGELPHWYSSMKPDENEGRGWYRRFDDPKAFRTVVLVRGAHPYVLFVDDLAIDEIPRTYNWAMTMPRDVVLESAKRTKSDAGASEADILLTESEKPDLSTALPSEIRRKLLLRVVSADELAEIPAEVVDVPVPNPPQPEIILNRLSIPSESERPGFKILAFPHREGDALPTTSWNADRTELTIAWPDQRDIVKFIPEPSGRTDVEISRDGTPILRRLAASSPAAFDRSVNRGPVTAAVR